MQHFENVFNYGWNSNDATSCTQLHHAATAKSYEKQQKWVNERNGATIPYSSNNNNDSTNPKYEEKKNKGHCLSVWTNYEYRIGHPKIHLVIQYSLEHIWMFECCYVRAIGFYYASFWVATAAAAVARLLLPAPDGITQFLLDQRTQSTHRTSIQYTPIQCKSSAFAPTLTMCVWVLWRVHLVLFFYITLRVTANSVHNLLIEDLVFAHTHTHRGVQFSSIYIYIYRYRPAVPSP